MNYTHDELTGEKIYEGEGCFYVEAHGFYYLTEGAMIESLTTDWDWTHGDIEDARTADLDDDGESLDNETIYWTTYEV